MKHRATPRIAIRLAATLVLAGCGHPKGAVHGTEPPPPIDAAVVVRVADAGPDPNVDSDGDGIPDVKDLCPQQAMVMTAGCEPARQQGCPDDCRPPLNVHEPMR